MRDTANKEMRWTMGLPELPTGARILVWVVGLGGFLFAGFLMWQRGAAIGDPLGLAFFAAILFICDLNRVRLPIGMNISVGTAVHFASAILFGPAWAAATAFLSAAITDQIQSKPWYKALFNAGNASIHVGISGMLFFLLYDGSSQLLGSLRNLSAVATYALASVLLNTVFLSVIVGLDRRDNIWEICRANLRDAMGQFAIMIPIGAMAAVYYRQSGQLGTLLLMLPAIVGYKGLQMSQRLRDETQKTIETLADSVDKRDPYTYSHSEAVAGYAVMIAKRLGLPPLQVQKLELAARVHDLGKVAIPDRILQKPDKLTEDEMKEMQRHPAIGAKMVSNLPIYGDETNAYILHHQEWFDGTGYPSGLRGEEIPLGARIIAVADAYQAMTSDRPYRRALSEDVAVAQLRHGRGTQFDPAIVDTFVGLLEQQWQSVEVTIRPAARTAQTNPKASPTN